MHVTKPLLEDSDHVTLEHAQSFLSLPVWALKTEASLGRELILKRTPRLPALSNEFESTCQHCQAKPQPTSTCKHRRGSLFNLIFDLKKLVMNPKVDFVARAEFMWYDGSSVPSKCAFSASYEPSETLVVVPERDSLTNLTYGDVLKNIETFPLNVFRSTDLEVKGKRVPVEAFGEYLAGSFYEKILKEHHGWDVATFANLDSKMQGRVVFLGESVDPEEEAERLATRLGSETVLNL